MKKSAIILTLILTALFVFAGCQSKAGGGESPVMERTAEPNGSTDGNNTALSEHKTDGENISEQDPEALGWDKIPMVMVDGKLYYDTGEESTVDGRCGVTDGEITSTVDGSETPTEDNQSNFGTGFEYQYGSGDTIEIFMNEKWIVFAHREET